MCMFIQICEYIYIYIYMYIYIYWYMYMYIYIYTYIHKYTCVYTCIYVDIYISIDIYLYIYMYTCIFSFTYTTTRMYTTKFTYNIVIYGWIHHCNQTTYKHVFLGEGTFSFDLVCPWFKKWICFIIFGKEDKNVILRRYAGGRTDFARWNFKPKPDSLFLQAILLKLSVEIYLILCS